MSIISLEIPEEILISLKETFFGHCQHFSFSLTGIKTCSFQVVISVIQLKAFRQITTASYC
jgi:hypothetical protein